MLAPYRIQGIARLVANPELTAALVRGWILRGREEVREETMGGYLFRRLSSPEALRTALPENDPLAPLVRALESGDSTIIFPDGTRGHGDDPQPFKSGLFRLAQMFPQVVLVPAWINNVPRVIPKGEGVPVPILCSVTFCAKPGADCGRMTGQTYPPARSRNKVRS